MEQPTVARQRKGLHVTFVGQVSEICMRMRLSIGIFIEQDE